jgi:outer membrane protein OmpA-like peptidoglycan-associated protein
MARRKKRLIQRIETATATRPDPATTPPPSFGPPDEDDMPVELATFIGTAVIGLLIIMGLGIYFGTRSIESTIETQTLNLLRSEGLRDIEVDADGLNVTLVGTVRDEQHVALAIAIGYAIEGVEDVDAQNVIYVPPPPDIDVDVTVLPLVFDWTVDAIAVSGTVSNEATRTLIISTLDVEWLDVDPSGLIVEQEMDSERDWLPSILQVVVRAGEDLEEGSVIANAGSSFVLVNGELETRAEQLAVRRDVEDLLSALTFQYTNGLTVKFEPPPPTSPPRPGTSLEPTTTTVAPEVIELQATLDELIEGKVVEFDFASAVITPEGRTLLDEVLEALETFPHIPVQISGHTDDIGSEESNLLLSRLRAAAVLSYLVDRGQSVDRFVVIGFGESEPIADNSTAEGRARNRRIEFTALSE